MTKLYIVSKYKSGFYIDVENNTPVLMPCGSISEVIVALENMGGKFNANIRKTLTKAFIDKTYCIIKTASFHFVVTQHRVEIESRIHADML